MKIFDLRRLRLSISADRDLENLRRESGILRGLPAHPNVVQMIDLVEDANWFFLVLELIPGGDLLSRIRALGRRHLGDAEVAHIARQLTEALRFLHGRNIVHRDLKLENVLVSSLERQYGARLLFSVKITDFGLSKAVGDGLSEARSMVGTRKYVAPEVLSGSVYDCRVDLWSLGVLSYLLSEGQFPHDQPASAPQSSLDHAVARMRVGKSGKAVISGLLRVDPGRRITLSELAADSWLLDCVSRDSEVIEVVSMASPSPSPNAVVVIGEDSQPEMIQANAGGLSFMEQPSSGDASSAFPLAPGAPLPAVSSASLLAASSMADLKSVSTAGGLGAVAQAPSLWDDIREESSARCAWAAAESDAKCKRARVDNA